MPSWSPWAAAVHALPQHTDQWVGRMQDPAGSSSLGFTTHRVLAARALGGTQQRAGSCGVQVQARVRGPLQGRYQQQQQQQEM